MSVQTTDTVRPLGTDPPRPTPDVTSPTGPPATSPGGFLSTTDASAKGIIGGFLGSYGLGSLADWAWGQWLKGESVDQIMLDLRSTPEYKARFPAMDALAKSGQAISETSYMQYEQSIHSLLQTSGLPKGMYDTPDQIAKMLVNNVSVTEAQSRVQLAQQAVLTAPASVRQALQAQTGLKLGDLTGYYLDTDKALPALQTQYAQAQITGAGIEQGLNVDQQTALNLAQQGVSYTQAQQGLGAVAQTGALGGGFGETSSQDQRIAAQFGNAGAQTQVGRVIQGRLATQQGGGGAAQTAQGLAGLGTNKQP